MLSVTTDYVKDTGSPEPYLTRIADAGFTHVHWCHQWNTDFLYSASEIDQIQAWFKECGLKLLDLHASHGKEKSWVSLSEYERLAGVDLIKNRIEMTSILSGDVIILHASVKPEEITEKKGDQLHRSLDELEPFARKHNVRIAIENGNFEVIGKIFSEYAPEYIGLCYDAGHGNRIPDALDRLGSIKDRLISVHLHDNDGTSDQHNLLFSGTIDWPRLAGILAQSAYSKCVSMEIIMEHSGIDNECAFLEKAFLTGISFSKMIEERTRVIHK